MKKSQKGISLVEIVIVILILGILSAVVSPRFNNALSTFRVDAAARRIISDLEAARRSAETTGTSRTVQFNTSLNQYTLVDVKDPDHPAIDTTVKLAKTGFPASLVSASFNSTTLITFDLYGNPLAGNPLSPLTTGTIVLRSGTLERTIVIDTLTGKAQIQ